MYIKEQPCMRELGYTECKHCDAKKTAHDAITQEILKGSIPKMNFWERSRENDR